MRSKRALETVHDIKCKQMYCNLLMMYDARYNFIFEVDMNLKGRVGT